MKKIALTILGLFIGSVLCIAQNLHWEPNTHQSGNMNVLGVVLIDGIEQTSETLELGVFYNDECRAAAMTLGAYEGHWEYWLTISGNENEVFTFKLYDHSINQELNLNCISSLPYANDAFIGPIMDPTEPYFEFAFTTPAPQPSTYELYIPGYGAGNTGGYYLIASPVMEEITPSAENGFVSGNFDLYYFDQTVEQEWINYDPNQFTIQSTKGYLYASESGTTLQFTGTPYSGNGNIPLVYDADSPSINMRGWNLIGNPYNHLVTIDKDNYYIMNEDGDDIIVADGTPITPMQGFFVLATREGESVTLSEYQAPIVPLDGVVLNLSRNRGNTIDRAIVRLGEGSTMPKFMLNPNNSKIYIEQDGNDYAVVNSTANELPVSFKAASNGTYTLKVAVENTEMHYLHLIDNIAGTDTDLLANPSYTFEANTGDHANRFTLVMSSTVGVEEHFAFFNGHNWTVSNQGEATLQVIDVTGRLVSTKTIDGTTQLDINAAPGVYMFRLVNGSDVKVQKVIVR